MIVRCRKIISPATGENLGDSSPWLIRNKAYIVLAMRYRSNEKTLEILLESDDYNYPAFFDINQFEIISNKVSSYWVFGMDEEGLFNFMPQEWFQDGFGEGIDNGDEGSLRLYSKYRDLIFQEDPIRGFMQIV